MKNLTFPVLLIVVAACLPAAADRTPAGEGSAQKLPGWGLAIDPDGDCKFIVTGNDLLIRVPESERAHDLAADIDTINAPRVLRRVNGDFTVQVRVDGRFEPGDESTKPGRKGYQGAGIIAMLDYRNVVTLARAALQSSEEGLVSYANFEIRVDGELLEIGQPENHPLPADGPVYLRLERRGSSFLGSVSTDGATWVDLGSKEVPAAWPQALKTGLVAISTSREVFIPRFSKFLISPFSALTPTPSPTPASSTSAAADSPARASSSDKASRAGDGHLSQRSQGNALTHFASREDFESVTSHREASRSHTTITLSGMIDGSEQFRFTAGRILWTHKFWSPPTDMIFGGKPWLDLNDTPALWRKVSEDLDLTRARIIQRTGRDIVALEPVRDGFVLTLSDSPNGADAYSVTIDIPGGASL